MDVNGKCDGHCENCNLNQRTYCAAQMAYYNQQQIAELKAALAERSSQPVLTNVGINKEEPEE